MRLRLALSELASQYRLDGPSRAALYRLAGLEQEPLARPFPLWRALAMLAAALVGLGIIFWLAANWDSFGRATHFILLQGVLLLTCAGAAWRSAARVPLALLALLAIGGLLAYFGQTYQSGADPWQLFALWVALGLPLCLAARSDVLWTPLVALLFTAMVLALTARLPWWPNQLAWCAALAVAAGLSAPCRRWTGAGVWSLRLALAGAVVVITYAGLDDVFDRDAGNVTWPLLALAALVAVLTVRRWHDLAGLCLAALAFDVLLVCALGVAWHDSMEVPLRFLCLALVAAALLVTTVHMLMKVARNHEGPPPAQAQSSRLDEIVSAAKISGLLPATAAPAPATGPSWPIVMVSSIGAWLVALPLLVSVLYVLWTLQREPGPAVGLLGGGLLCAAVVLLRAYKGKVVPEQLAAVLLLAGAGALVVALLDMPQRMAACLLWLVAAGVAWSTPQSWLRSLLGAAAALLLVWGCLPSHDGQFGVMAHSPLSGWVAWHGALALWLLAQAWLRRFRSAALEAFALGWGLAILAGLACAAGVPMLAAVVLQPDGGGLLPFFDSYGADSWAAAWQQYVSAALTLAGAAAAMYGWPVLRRSENVGAAAIMALLAWHMPTLGAVLAMAGVATCCGRHRTATAAALAAAWIFGTFYYERHWQLTDKARMLAVCGAVLATLAWIALPGRPAIVQAPGPTTGRGSRAGIALIALCLVAVLAIANIGIWRKETLLASGQVVFLALAPVDPRSLLQGDYMRLNFPAVNHLAFQGHHPDRPARRIVAGRDSRGIAIALRVDDGAALAANEVRLAAQYRAGRWQLGPDAWFFKEGQAARWSGARYGEFRVGSDGSTMLVNLRGPDLAPL